MSGIGGSGVGLMGLGGAGLAGLGAISGSKVGAAYIELTVNNSKAIAGMAATRRAMEANAAAMAKAQMSAGQRMQASLASSLGSMGQRWTRSGMQMVSVGASLTRRLSIPIGLVGAAATKMALDFDTAITRVKALGSTAGFTMDELKEKVMALSGETAQAPTDLANALYFVSSAGLKTNQIFPVLEQSARAAMAGMGDVATVGQFLTSVMNAYHGTGLDAAGATDILAEAMRQGKAEPEEFAQHMGVVIPVASQMGVSFDQVAGILANATNYGVEFTRAVTGMRYLLASIQNPTEAAKGVLDDYGLSIGQIQNMIAEPNGMLTTLKFLADRFDLSSTKGREAWATFVGGARGAVIANTAVGKNFARTTEIMDAMSESADGFSNSFEKAQRAMRKREEFQFQRAMNELRRAMIELGEIIVPILVDSIIPAIKDMAKAFQGLSPGMQEWIVKLGAIALLLGPASMLVGGLKTLSGILLTLTSRLLGLGAAGTSAGTGLGAFATGASTATTAATAAQTAAGTGAAAAASRFGISPGGPPPVFGTGPGPGFGTTPFNPLMGGLALTGMTVASQQGLSSMTDPEVIDEYIQSLREMGVTQENVATVTESLNTNMELGNEQFRANATVVQFAAENNVSYEEAMKRVNLQLVAMGRPMLNIEDSARNVGKALEEIPATVRNFTTALAGAKGATDEEKGAFAELLQPLARLGIELDPLAQGMIREAIAAGRLNDAAALLGATMGGPLRDAMRDYGEQLTKSELKSINAAIESGNLWQALTRLNNAVEDGNKRWGKGEKAMERFGEAMRRGNGEIARAGRVYKPALTQAERFAQAIRRGAEMSTEQRNSLRELNSRLDDAGGKLGKTASEAFRAAVKTGDFEEAARLLYQALQRIPDSKNTNVKVDGLSEAISGVGTLVSKLGMLRDRTINIHTSYTSGTATEARETRFGGVLWGARGGGFLAAGTQRYRHGSIGEGGLEHVIPYNSRGTRILARSLVQAQQQARQMMGGEDGDLMREIGRAVQRGGGRDGSITVVVQLDSHKISQAVKHAEIKRGVRA